MNPRFTKYRRSHGSRIKSGMTNGFLRLRQRHPLIRQVVYCNALVKNHL